MYLFSAWMEGKSDFYLHYENQEACLQHRTQNAVKGPVILFSISDEETIILRSKDLLKVPLLENHRRTVHTEE